MESVSPERVSREQALYVSRIPGVALEAGESMDSSSTSGIRGENESTTKARGVKTVKVTETKLRYRRVFRDAKPDEMMEHLRTILKTELPERPMSAIPELQSVARRFLEEARDHADESCYPFLDELQFSLDRGKATIGFPIISVRYFEANLKRCLSKNEAVLQRTIMMNVVDHYWLGDLFDWNTEGQWSQPKDTRLLSREDDEISLPKPDLAISFTLRSFTGEEDDSDPIPAELERCISPDGGDRCFPFLFMEVKKAAADLQDAYLANLHNASQALYNIYLWMVRADQETLFYNKVRVFSLVFNAQDLSVRVHRAAPTVDGNISFRFDEVSTLARYTRDQACVLVSTILNNYAAKELHPALKTAYAEVISQEDERVLNKRKAKMARSGSSKRARKSKEPDQHTGQSFSMGQLNT